MNEKKDPFDDFLHDIGVNSGESPYEKIDQDEIDESKERNPLAAALMTAANKQLNQAEQQAEGEKLREPTYHHSGWTILLETPSGPVGIDSSWMSKSFTVTYPKDMTVDDEVIKNSLGVRDSSPVTYVSEMGVHGWDYQDDEEEPEFPLDQNAAGQIIAYTREEDRKWGDFYGNIESGGGRVWVEHVAMHTYSVHLTKVTSSGKENIYHGHDMSKTICTHLTSRHNKYAYEAPTTDPEAIQKYRTGFVDLAVEIARQMGGVTAIHVDYGFSMVPEDLQREGYENINWVKGGWGQRKDRFENEDGKEDCVIATKGDTTVMILSGHKYGLVPWKTVVRYPVTDPDTDISSLILDELLYF